MRTVVAAVVAAALCCLVLPCVLAATDPVYVARNIQKTSSGITAQLDLMSGAGPYGDDLPSLGLSVEFRGQSYVRVRIFDRLHSRWEVPEVLAFDPGAPFVAPTALDYDVALQENPFSLQVTRRADKEIIFDSSGSNLIFEDHYLRMSTRVANNPNIYGLGERVHNFRLDPNDKTYTIFTKDNGNTPDINLYGAYPMFMEFRQPTAYGVFLLNSNAMDVSISSTQQLLTFETIGGILDFHIVSGPSPLDVIRQFSDVLGKPNMPSYWSLGWHQCRWGYRTVQDVQAVVSQYQTNNLPLDTMWNDIDYMNLYQDFTFSPDRYPLAEVQKFVDSLHKNHQQYVIIVDPGIQQNTTYEVWNRFVQQKAYIPKPDSDEPIINEVWPGDTGFPDFTSAAGHSFWVTEIKRFHQSGAPFDGLWIDMNEPIGFCNAQCSEDASSGHMHSAMRTTFDPNHPPFVPGNVPLYYRTLNMSSPQAWGLHYDVHSLFGYTETMATRDALESVRGKRALVISRSSFAGQQKNGYHWLGDNESTFQSMTLSISGILSMNMFGVQLVGADICGFNGNTTRELCERWMALGTLYPFSRNHNSLGMLSQEPYAFGPETTEIMRGFLENRYRLLPYLYSLFADSHLTGSPVWRAIFQEFPEETEPTLPFLDRQFMVGPALMSTPALDVGVTSVSAYFPNARWFDWNSGAEMEGYAKSWQTVASPLDKQLIFHRGGHAIPLQRAALTSYEGRQTPFTLVVPLDQEGSAKGWVFVDDGESLTNMENKEYLLVELSASSPSSNAIDFSAKTLVSGYTTDSCVEEVRILGVVQPSVSSVTLNGQAITSFSLDASTHVLTIHLDLIPLHQDFSILIR